MPSTRSSSIPKVWLSSTVMTPSLPTFSSDSAIICPISLSAAEMAATLAIAEGSVSTFFDAALIESTATMTAPSMPFFRVMGFAPAATLRRPSRTMAQASTVAVVVPSPATSSVFLATSLTSSAPIFSKGSSRSISLAIDTPSFVIVGAPHFFSRTTLRPRGPRGTRHASAGLFIPAPSARRAARVSETVGRLVDQGFVELDGDRHLSLTTKGRGLATTIVRRHRLAERLLVDVIGLEWEKVHAEAARWEHAISADVEEKLVLLLGDPATCPHGNPIPGSHHAAPAAPTVALSDAKVGPVTVARVSERLEMSDEA